MTTFKYSSLWLALLAMACTGAWAQKGGGGGGGSAGAGGSGMSGVQNGPTNPKAKNDQETAAVKAVTDVYNDTSTSPDQMEQAIAAFMVKYPKSDFVFQVDRLGLRYFASPNHPDPDKVVAYTQKALKLVSTDLFTFVTAGQAVPRFEKADDPNLAANLALADQWNNKVLAAAKMMSDGSRGSRRGGGGADADPDAAKAAADKVAQAKAEKENVEYNAYIGLARSATLRKVYPEAQKNFDLALTVADYSLAHADLVRSETYLYMAQFQEIAQQWPAASASLDQAAKLDTTSPELQQLVAAEQAKVKAAAH